MNFGEPGWLWGVAGVAVLAIVFLWRSFDAHARAGTRGRWPRILRVTAAASGVRPTVARGRPRTPWFLVLAAALMFCALAKPRWGRIEEEVVEQAREVMLALDLSRSMLVTDVPPSRLERAKLLTKTLLDALQGERVGLIVFAGTAFVQVPLSPDYQILHEFLPELNPAYMPQGGTDYAGMLRAALDGFGRDDKTDRFLIVLSDGESQTETWREQVPELRERGVQVLTLGLGTPEGGFIPDGSGAYVKDERGAVVLSRLETRTLQSLAQETRGTYRNASEWVDLPALLEATVARSRQGQFAGRRQERFLERYQWFLAPALVFALLGLWRDVPVRPRPQTIRRAGPAPTSQASGTTAGKIATATALLAWMVFVSPASAPLGAAENAPDTGPEARVRETVARLATTPQPTARDWRELADRTLVYGSGARMQQQPLEPGAIRDALIAVDRGERANPQLADWKKLRADLNALLESPPEDKPPESPPPPEQPEQDEQEEDDEKQQDQSESQNQAGDPSNPQEQPPSEEQQGEPPPQQPEGAGSEQAPDDAPPPSTPPDPSAGGQPKEGELGDMQGPAAPPPAAPPPPDAEEQPKTHKIGGKPAEDQPPPTDAATAILQQRMREAAENDSPARLYQLIQGDEKEAAPRGRDW